MEVSCQPHFPVVNFAPSFLSNKGGPAFANVSKYFVFLISNAHKREHSNAQGTAALRKRRHESLESTLLQSSRRARNLVSDSLMCRRQLRR